MVSPHSTPDSPVLMSSLCVSFKVHQLTEMQLESGMLTMYLQAVLGLLGFLSPGHAGSLERGLPIPGGKCEPLKYLLTTCTKLAGTTQIVSKLRTTFFKTRHPKYQYKELLLGF